MNMKSAIELIEKRGAIVSVLTHEVVLAFAGKVERFAMNYRTNRYDGFAEPCLDCRAVGAWLRKVGA